MALLGGAGVADTDLCIVPVNLIENTLNALKKQQDGRPILRVKAKIEENRVLIAVDNSVRE